MQFFSLTINWVVPIPVGHEIEITWTGRTKVVGKDKGKGWVYNKTPWIRDLNTGIMYFDRTVMKGEYASMHYEQQEDIIGAPKFIGSGGRVTRPEAELIIEVVRARVTECQIGSYAEHIFTVIDYEALDAQRFR